MRLPLARAIRGVGRPGRKTKKLIPLLRRGDIAIIDHPDIDIVCANALIDRRVAAVINCAVSLTGRYPAAGPGAIWRQASLSLTAPARADGEHCPTR